MLKINKNSLMAILSDFYTLTNIRVAIYDSDYSEILAYPFDRIPFCELIRRKQEMVDRCDACDKNALKKCNKIKKPWIYKCHAGLVEVATPIIEQSAIVGYAMFGQIMDQEDMDDRFNIILSQFSEGNYPGVTSAIEQIKGKTKRQIEAAATVLEAITLYLLSNRVVLPQRREFIEQVNEYIDNHIESKITAEELSFFFGLSRSKLFEVVNMYLSCSPADYIKGRRILRAKELLLNTELNVSEVANACGFSDYVYFSRVFKKATGVSAKEFRESYRLNK